MCTRLQGVVITILSFYFAGSFGAYDILWVINLEHWEGMERLFVAILFIVTVMAALTYPGYKEDK